MTPEQRQFLEQRRQELKRELREMSTGQRRVTYVDSHERMQDLQDELDDIDRLLSTASYEGR